MSVKAGGLTTPREPLLNTLFRAWIRISIRRSSSSQTRQRPWPKCDSGIEPQDTRILKLSLRVVRARSCTAVAARWPRRSRNSRRSNTLFRALERALEHHKYLSMWSFQTQPRYVKFKDTSHYKAACVVATMFLCSHELIGCVDNMHFCRVT